jgi:hypothetical protein
MYRHIPRPCRRPITPTAVSPTAVSPTGVRPIVCPPLCRYTDSYIQREVPYIQPLINVNRQHIVDVPRTYYEQINRNVIVPPYQNAYGNQYPRY